MLGGVGAIFGLPVEQYPDVAPPQVNMRASYPGASAETLENSVTQVIEQQLTGIDGLLYFSSFQFARAGERSARPSRKGTDPDIAQVQVQNKVQQALSRLPAQVQQQGLTRHQVQSRPAADRRRSMTRPTADQPGRVGLHGLEPAGADRPRCEGVGDSNVFGAICDARVAQPRSPGILCADAERHHRRDHRAEYRSRGGRDRRPAPAARPDAQCHDHRPVAACQTPAEVRGNIVKTQTNGASVRLKDVARVELGAENYNRSAASISIPAPASPSRLAPGADALKTAELVKAEIEAISRRVSPKAGLRL
jgi:multidrug efflux pump